MNKYLKMLFVLSAVALLGQGCFGATETPPPANKAPVPTPSQPTTTPPTPTPSTPTTTPSTPPTPTAPTSTSGYQIPLKDDTWKTYTNNSLQFAFDWPTKGRYAPEWEVKFYGASDSTNINNGCFVGGEAMDPTKRTSLTVGEQVFCRTEGIGVATGSQYHSQYYTTQIKNTYVVVSFVKRSTTGNNYDDARCSGKLVLSGPPSCIEFEPALFTQQTEMIMQTFRKL